MCRLLGVAANKEVGLEFSFYHADKPVEGWSTINRDGWGIGWYENGEAKVNKHSGKFPENKYEVLHARSKIILSHVRYGMGAPATDNNAHPFRYGQWLFAHNGALGREMALELLDDDYRRKIEGETASEVFFYLIMQKIERKGSKNVPQCIDCIGEVVSLIRKRQNPKYNPYLALNFLLTDGSVLYGFCFADERAIKRFGGSHYSMKYLYRDPKSRALNEYRSKQTSQMLKTKELTGQKAVLIASEAMTEDENWKTLRFGDLIVVRPNLKTETISLC